MAKKQETNTETGLSGSQLKKITIRNFRCIGKEGVSIELDQIVVLVGSNNVGKSTILRAYQYIMDNQIISSEDFPNGRYDESNPPTIELETWVSREKPGQDWLIHDDQTREYIREQWVWAQCGSPTREGWHALDNTWVKEVPWGAPNVAKSKRPRPHRIDAFANPNVQAQQVAKLLLQWVKERTSNSSQDESTTLFDELISVYEDVHTKLIQETRQRVEGAEEKISSLIAKIFSGYKVKFEVPMNDDPNKIIESLFLTPIVKMGPNNGFMANIQDQGSGAQRTLLWTALKLLAEEHQDKDKKKKTSSKESLIQKDNTNQDNQRPNILLIDEPEICLHPSAVRDACKTLYDLAENETGWQVMVTTHSPVFIDITRDHTTVVRVMRDEKGIMSSTTIFRPDKAKLTEDDQRNLKLLNLWDPYVAEFFFGGRVILVEGDTEYSAFKVIIDEQPSIFNDVHIIRARGKAILVPLIKILNHFGQPYSVLHDADTPFIETKNGSQTNGMWTENQKIKDETLLSTSPVRIVASIKDFETAIFGISKASKSDKPYNTWAKLMESPEHKKIASSLLEGLIDHTKPLPDKFLTWNNLDELTLAVDGVLRNE